VCDNLSIIRDDAGKISAYKHEKVNQAANCNIARWFRLYPVAQAVLLFIMEHIDFSYGSSGTRG